MKKHCITLIRQLFVVALLSAAICVQAQTSTVIKNVDYRQITIVPISSIDFPPELYLDCSNYDFDEEEYLPIEVCPDIANYSSVQWTTSGDGFFADPNSLCTQYELGDIDIWSDDLMLTIEVQGSTSCKSSETYSQLVHIPKQFIDIKNDGFQGMSSYIDKSDENIEDFLAPIHDELIIIEDETGSYYWPIPIPPINELGNWDAIGYKAKFAAPCCLPVYGNLLEDRNFNIYGQFTYLPVLSTMPLNIDDFFQDHYDEISFIMDWELDTYWAPNQGNNTLSTLVPGKAYFLMTTGPATNFTVFFPQENLLEVAEDTLVVSAAGNPVSFSISTNNSWYANSNMEWVSVEINGNNCTVSCTPNVLDEPRTATLRITAVYTNPVDVIIFQNGKNNIDEITLYLGWNLISFDISPEVATPESIFETLIAGGNLEMVTGFQSQMGVFFDPVGLPFLNTLQELIPGEGYWVKVTDGKDDLPEGISDPQSMILDIRSGDQIKNQKSLIANLKSPDGSSRDQITLTVSGDVISTDFTINLQSGWNLIAYWPAETNTPETTFETLITTGILEMVTGYEQGGLIFDPNGLPFLNTLTEIKNGFGYWVKVNIDFDAFSYPVWQCGYLLVDERNGQSYETVQISDQCWMAENLNIGIRIDGANVHTDNGSIEKYCYDDDESNCDDYGALYQWDEMMQYSTTVEVQGICPPNWHVPSVTEWSMLVDYIVAQGFAQQYNDPNGAGNALKSCRQVNTPISNDCNTLEHPRWNADLTYHGFDEFAFSGFPGGVRQTYGEFESIGISTGFWSTENVSSTTAKCRSLDYNNAVLWTSYVSKGSGYSVRCLRD